MADKNQYIYCNKHGEKKKTTHKQKTIQVIDTRMSTELASICPRYFSEVTEFIFCLWNDCPIPLILQELGHTEVSKYQLLGPWWVWWGCLSHSAQLHNWATCPKSCKHPEFI